MDVSDEESRLVLGEKRRPSFDSSENQRRQPDFRLAKCRKLDGGNDAYSQEGHRSYKCDLGSRNSMPEKFRVRLEICSPDSFSVTPVQAQGFRFPEEQGYLRQLSEILHEVSCSRYLRALFWLMGGKKMGNFEYFWVF